jgi:hypothetical protein
MRTTATWALRAAVVAALAVLAARILRTGRPSGAGASPAAPVIGGDTWPPVPLNPDRTG